MFGKKGYGVCSCAKIKHVTEGKTPHVTIEKVKAQHKNAENNKICCPVYAQDRKYNKKTCCNNENLKEIFPARALLNAESVFCGVNFASLLGNPPAPVVSQGAGGCIIVKQDS